MHYEIIKYPDGSSYIKVNEFKKEFTYKINNYEDLWNLVKLIDIYEYHSIFPTVIIPCLLDAQADQRFNDNESFNLKLILKLLNSLSANFKVFHPHNKDAIAYGSNNITSISNTTYINQVLDLNNPNLALMSPDAGMYKNIMKLAKDLNFKGPVYTACKSREYINGKSKLIQIVSEIDFKGQDITIIDDICIYGGTFKGLSKILKERNCGKLNLIVSHITIQDLGDDPVTNYFDKVFTTNSKYDVYFSNNNPIDNLKIINMF